LIFLIYASTAQPQYSRHATIFGGKQNSLRWRAKTRIFSSIPQPLKVASTFKTLLTAEVFQENMILHQYDF